MTLFNFLQNYDNCKIFPIDVNDNCPVWTVIDFCINRLLKATRFQHLRFLEEVYITNNPPKKL